MVRSLVSSVTMVVNVARGRLRVVPGKVSLLSTCQVTIVSTSEGPGASNDLGSRFVEAGCSFHPSISGTQLCWSSPHPPRWTVIELNHPGWLSADPPSRRMLRIEWPEAYASVGRGVGTPPPTRRGRATLAPDRGRLDGLRRRVGSFASRLSIIGAMVEEAVGQGAMYLTCIRWIWPLNGKGAFPCNVHSHRAPLTRRRLVDTRAFDDSSSIRRFRYHEVFGGRL
jgi:hypothetical protein